jgi:hypothetical protein
LTSGQLAQAADKRLFPHPVDASGTLVEALMFDRAAAVR